MDNFANEDPGLRKEAFQQASAELGFSEAIVEKDFWVCWSLSKLMTLPGFGDQMIFKGGTSLSKAYAAINRFSEDVDLSPDRGQLGFSGDRAPENPGLSGKNRKALLQELQDEATKAVGGPILSEIVSIFGATIGQDHRVEVDVDDPQTVLFTYPVSGSAAPAAGYVQPIVRFEFGARGVQIPAEDHQLTPYVHDALPDLLVTPHFTARVLGVERTFWEKATILHMLFHQDPEKPLGDRMSRHYYDMAMLIDHDAKARALGDLAQLEQVAHHKSAFFKAAWANYEDAQPGSLKLRPGPELEKALRRDYSGMREMIIGDVPEFDEILSKIEGLETEINASLAET